LVRTCGRPRPAVRARPTETCTVRSRAPLDQVQRGGRGERDERERDQTPARPCRGLRRTAALVYGDRLRAGLGVDEGIHLVPDLRARLHRAQAFAVEARQDDGNVVGSAALVGQRDQPVARRLQVALARGDLGDLFLLYGAGESVGAQHEDVAPPDFLMGEIHLHPRVGPERLEDDVAALALRRFLFRQLTRLDQTLHQGLVLGELDGLALTDEVGAAVTYLREEKAVAEHADGGRRRPHAAELGVRPGVRVDLAV